MLVGCRWFDIESVSCNTTFLQSHHSKPINPDLRTFKALETFIQRVYEAGGHVHIWAWGDEERKQTPISIGGLNGEADRRLQRYIAARLGPITGWTMGYGFDLHEWVRKKDLKSWHGFMSQRLGWPHLLGARSRSSFKQIYNGLNYYSYEQIRPDYQTYLKTISMSKEKPAFSEDRFRMGRSGYEMKDYNEIMIRRGLWHSSMAGGVANIWGNLTDNDCANSGDCPSSPFDHPAWIKTHSLFFNRYFDYRLIKDSSIYKPNTMILHSTDLSRIIMYTDNTTTVELKINKLLGSREVLAIDTKSAYIELPIGKARLGKNTFHFPYRSDWALAIGFN